MLGVAKTMMSDVFMTAMPAIVTAAFASSYILMLSAGNLGGRLAWALVFDKLGAKKTFSLITMGCIPFYLAVPQCVGMLDTSGGAAVSSLPLYGFIASTVLAVSCMGATYALLPAFEAKLFGPKMVSAIHGRTLLG